MIIQNIKNVESTLWYVDTNYSNHTSENKISMRKCDIKIKTKNDFVKNNF